MHCTRAQERRPCKLQVGGAVGLCGLCDFVMIKVARIAVSPVSFITDPTIFLSDILY